MYIFELLAKKFFKKKKINIEEIIEETDYNCDHVYLVIDSSKDYLACNKCGNVIKNTQKDLKAEEKEKNIFNFFK